MVWKGVVLNLESYLYSHLLDSEIALSLIQLKKCGKIALLCVQRKRKSTKSEVISLVFGNSKNLEMLNKVLTCIVPVHGEVPEGTHTKKKLHLGHSVCSASIII